MFYVPFIPEIWYCLVLYIEQTYKNVVFKNEDSHVKIFNLLFHSKEWTLARLHYQLPIKQATNVDTRNSERMFFISLINGRT